MNAPALFLALLLAQVTSPPQSAQDVIDRMIARNAGLVTYTARVHVEAHPSIPLCTLHTDGVAYYKRPGSFAVVLNPASGLCASSLRGIQSISTDVGNPLGWEKDSNIALQGTSELDGKPMIELVLTKKIYSDQIKDTIVYVDPQSYEVVEMDWHYTNGDAIAMKQYFATEDGFTVVTRQHFEGRRRISFTGDSTYDSYQMNVAVNDAVFTEQQ
ncbi:MAG TPA: hypothetical protein VMA98_00485 [Candidatus Acidoferrales bacterium]|nr:hypothetical protein [Candidatus Acidoferrales bacterium]